MYEDLESFKRNVTAYDNRTLLTLYGSLFYTFAEYGEDDTCLKLDFVEELLLKRMGGY